MEKPKSLRALLHSVVPELKRHPTKLEMYAKAGKVRANFSLDRMNYEYVYDLEITILDFTEAPDTVFLPIIIWLHRHEVAALQNPDRDAIQFEIDVVDDKSVDISITLKLTEAMDVTPRKEGGHTMQARKEAPMADHDPDFPCLKVRLREIYDGDNNLIVPDVSSNG